MTVLANNNCLVQLHILRVKIQKSDETLSNNWMISDISPFPDIHERAVHNALTKADQLYILPDTCQEVLFAGRN